VLVNLLYDPSYFLPQLVKIKIKKVTFKPNYLLKSHFTRTKLLLFLFQDNHLVDNITTRLVLNPKEDQRIYDFIHEAKNMSRLKAKILNDVFIY